MARTTQGDQMADTGGSITLTNEQLQMLIDASKQPSNAGLTAKDLAEAFAATQKKENPTAPMVSSYNPLGDNVRPRPALRCKTSQNGVVLDPDTLTWEEIEALNLLPPGDFMVSKANGQRIRFMVQYTRGADGERIERVDVSFPSKDEHKYDHRGLFEYCVDVLELSGRQDDVDRLRALRREFDLLRRKSA